MRLTTKGDVKKELGCLTVYADRAREVRVLEYVLYA